MLAILSIIIGLIFVLLLFSMLSSTMLELIDALFALRGRHLRETLENMLGEQANAFFRHPIFRQMSYAANHRKTISASRLPGWINKSTFSAIVLDIMNARNLEEVSRQVNNMDESETKRLLTFLIRQSGGDLDVFKAKVEHWFDEIMQRATEWYKNNTKWWLFFIGITLAAIFNADTIQIYKSLSVNAAARDKLVELADRFEATHDSVPAIQLGKDVQLTTAEYKAVSANFKEVIQPLGLGWSDQESGNSPIWWWLVKFAGLLLTGLAVTLGAPFWFEMLRKILSVRTAVKTGDFSSVTVQSSTGDTSIQKVATVVEEKAPPPVENPNLLPIRSNKTKPVG